MYTKSIRFLTILLVLGLIAGNFANVHAASSASSASAPTATATAGQTKFSTGWWLDREKTKPSGVTTDAGQGNNFMLLAGWFVDRSQLSTTISYLDAAQAAGARLIVGLEGGATPTMSQTDIQYVVNGLKSHPALYGYYIGDEPELNVSADTLTSRHATLVKYYAWIKAADPSHPIMISFNEPYNEANWTAQSTFYDATDIIGIHAYPFWSTGGEFGTIEGRQLYDVWKRGKGNADALGKGFIATAQGFGDNSGSPYRNPTLNELRYQVFSAVVQGIPTVMFWIDSWGSTSGMLDRVKTVVGQENEIAAQMVVGTTTTTDKLVYRSGTANNTGAILAVNIANRTGSGSTFTAQFTVPANVSQVTVNGESRTIAASGGVFSDSFKPFEVHVYTYSASASTASTATATLVPSSTPTKIASTATNVPTKSPTPVPASPTATFTSLPTQKPTLTPTSTATVAKAATFTPTPTAVFTATQSITLTPIPSLTATTVDNTATAVPQATDPASPTPIPATATATVSDPAIPTVVPATETSVPTETAQPAATNTVVPTDVPPAFTATPVLPEPTQTQPAPVNPSPTPGITPVNPSPTPAGPNGPNTFKRIFDDDDPGMIYSADWTDVNNKRAYENGFKLTSQRNAYVTFNFTGRTFAVLFTSGKRNGRFDVYIDGIKVDSFNEKTMRTNYQQVYRYRGILSPGQHELRLVFAGPKSSEITFDGIVVMQAP